MTFHNKAHINNGTELEKTNFQAPNFTAIGACITNQIECVNGDMSNETLSFHNFKIIKAGILWFIFLCYEMGENHWQPSCKATDRQMPAWR